MISAKTLIPAYDFLSCIADLAKNGGCRVVAIIQQRTWTNGKARNHVSSLHSLLMQLCALETHIRMSRNLEKFIDLMANHRSGPEPSPSGLQVYGVLIR